MNMATGASPLWNSSIDPSSGIFETGDVNDTASGWSWLPLVWNWWVILQLMSAVLGMAGNLLVILVLYQCRAASRSTDILVGSLATADFLASFLMIPIPPHQTVPVSRIGNVYCWFVGNSTIMWICLTASTFNLVAISCDRYFAIVHPLQFMRYVTKGRVRVSVLLIWAAVFILVGLPICISYGVDSDKKTCGFLFESSTAKAVYGWFIFLLRLIIPTMILVVTQSAIAIVLHRESKAFRKDVDGAMHSQRSVHLEARDHVIKLMLIVSIAFIICWSPSQIFFFGINIGFISFEYLYTPTQRICKVLTLCNSCLNPIIYIARHPHFRVAVKELFNGSKAMKNRGPIFEHKTENRETSMTLSTIA